VRQSFQFPRIGAAPNVLIPNPMRAHIKGKRCASARDPISP
jgi:hypothetical protein